MASNSSDRLNGWGSDQAIKAPCVVATTANITLSAVQTIDGVAVVAEDRVLVKDQTTGTEDGIYICKSSSWERARDWNGNKDAVNGTLVIVRTGGTTNGNTLWRASATDDPYVIDTVDPTFVLAEFLNDISGRVTYTFDSSTSVSVDPGNGDFRLNHATIASATVISFSDNTADYGNPDYSPYLVTWDDSTSASLRGTITVSELGNPSIFAIFSVNAALTDGTTYVDIPVAYVTGSGSFTAASKYVVSFSRTGNLGASNGVEMKWDVSTTDADQGAGTVWLNNATVASATVLYLDDVDNAAGASINSWVDSFDDSTNTDLRGTVKLTKQRDQAVFAIFNVTSAVTSSSTYSSMTVAYVTGAGSFTADDKVSVEFSRTGDIGTGAGVRMLWDVSTNDGDQGAGTVWLNNASPASATIVYLDDVEDAGGASINSWVDSFDDSTAAIQGTLTLTVQTNPAVFAVFNVTGAVTSASTYSKIASTYVTGAGSFTAADKVAVSFARSGDDGADGATGATDAEKTNIMLNAFRISVNGGLTVQNMVDGVVDEFTDETGVDTVTSTNEIYDAINDLYGNQVAGATEDGGWAPTTTSTSASTYIDRTFAVDNGATVSHIAVYNAQATSGNLTVKIANEDSTTQYDIVVSESFAFDGSGWQTFVLATPYVVPGTGTYRVGVYVPAVTFDTAASQLRSKAVGDITGDNQAFTALSDACPRCRVTYQGAVSDMTLVSNASTALAQPTDAFIVLRQEDVDAVTLNTDLTAEVSRDGGTTWTAITLVEEAALVADRVLAGSVDISAQPAGTSMKYRIKTLNTKNQYIHAVGLEWS